MTKTQDKQITFEEALAELEEIAEKLERGQLSLEESIVAYEKGMTLKKICLERLKTAEGRIEFLAKNKEGKVVKENAKKEIDEEENLF
ncbi:MAG: exodeoxyribonuclease VII small subunit [Leptospiraceae bacterium]|nr:exodeoxyribonuclease VII small subunit [Leptospiraceae bacterium]MCK6379788.1 exodeoxyribonuclease VII small subunit [Leptospiraceae bacterium]NUM41357.1 exodeoxyribonuclease VII small subunit [Leptospiraceae bacterium]